MDKRKVFFAAALCAVLATEALSQTRVGFSRGPGMRTIAGGGGFRQTGSIGNSANGRGRMSFAQTNRVVSRREAQRNAFVPTGPAEPSRATLRPTTAASRSGGFNHGQFVTGSGISITGSVTGDNFNMVFNVGGTGLKGCVPNRSVRFCPTDPGFNGYDCFNGNWAMWPSYGYGGYWGWPYYERSYAIDGGYYTVDPALMGQAQPSAPAIAETPSQPVAPATDRDIGAMLMDSGQYDDAVASYRRHMAAYPSDGGAMREFAVALIGAGDTREAVAVMGMAYRMDQRLAAQPFDASQLYGGKEELRRLLNKVSIYANRVNSASAWLTMAVLMQSEGRIDQARTMVGRARNAGLDAVVTDVLLAAMK